VETIINIDKKNVNITLYYLHPKLEEFISQFS